MHLLIILILCLAFCGEPDLYDSLMNKNQVEVVIVPANKPTPLPDV